MNCFMVISNIVQSLFFIPCTNEEVDSKKAVPFQYIKLKLGRPRSQALNMLTRMTIRVRTDSWIQNLRLFPDFFQKQEIE